MLVVRLYLFILLGFDTPRSSQKASCVGFTENPHQKVHHPMLHPVIDHFCLVWVNNILMVQSWKIPSHGGFLSHRATPSHHPFPEGIFPFTKTIQLRGYPHDYGNPHSWKPPYVTFDNHLNGGFHQWGYPKMVGLLRKTPSRNGW